MSDNAAARMIAVLDKSGVLVDRINNPTDEQWQETPARLRFPDGFDNAVGRYKLVEGEPGRWRFEPVPHALDAAAENTEAGRAVIAPMARVVSAIAAGEVPAAADVAALNSYLSTIDGA